MRSSFTGLPTAVKTTMAGFILGAAMLVPVYAQQPPASGAQGSVTITDEEKAKAGAEAAPSAEAAAPKVQVPKQAVTNRDPFVYQLNAEVQVKRKVKAVTPPPRKAGEAAASKDAAGAAKTATGKPGEKAAAAEPVVAPPAVTVTGIINGPQNRAILTAPNQSYIVKVGDKLGDYKVAGITAKAVLFKYKDKSFKIVMEDEFTAKK